MVSAMELEVTVVLEVGVVGEEGVIVLLAWHTME